MELHVFCENEGFEIWLDNDGSEQEGVCIAFSRRRKNAIKKTIKELYKKIEELKIIYKEDACLR